ncbi:hypothetical protein HaLaN_12903, partial [Haematococcus lacustris]
VEEQGTSAVVAADAPGSQGLPPDRAVLWAATAQYLASLLQASLAVRERNPQRAAAKITTTQAHLQAAGELEQWCRACLCLDWVGL